MPTNAGGSVDILQPSHEAGDHGNEFRWLHGLGDVHLKTVKNGAPAIFGARKAVSAIVGTLPPSSSVNRRTLVWPDLQQRANTARVERITSTALMAHDFVFMKSSTKDKIKGAFEEARGKMKEETGKVTRNPDLQDRGTVEKIGGKVQRKIGDVKKVFEQ